MNLDELDENEVKIIEVEGGLDVGIIILLALLVSLVFFGIYFWSDIGQ